MIVEEVYAADLDKRLKELAAHKIISVVPTEIDRDNGRVRYYKVYWQRAYEEWESDF